MDEDLDAAAAASASGDDDDGDNLPLPPPPYEELLDDETGKIDFDPEDDEEDDEDDSDAEEDEIHVTHIEVDNGRGGEDKVAAVTQHHSDKASLNSHDSSSGHSSLDKLESSPSPEPPQLLHVGPPKAPEPPQQLNQGGKKGVGEEEDAKQRRRRRSSLANQKLGKEVRHSSTAVLAGSMGLFVQKTML